MTARRYTQSQVEAIFAKAEAAADRNAALRIEPYRTAFILGYVTQSFGVKVAVSR